MGVVYAAQHVLLGQHVAVKVLASRRGSPHGTFQRALSEAQASARLTSEHVARVFDVGVTGAGQAYVVMERLIGDDLLHVLRSGLRAPVEEAVKIVLQACHALAEAHASGTVHRDIKPSNLFLAKQSDGTLTVKVLDFGLACGLEASCVEMRVGGSPGYASPEQLDGSSDVDARADVWGLGVVLYELVTGHRPSRAMNGDELPSAARGFVPPMVSPHGPVPPAFESIVRRCMEVDRERRFASVIELAEALGPFAPPAYAHYPRRIRDVVAIERHSAGALPIPADGPTVRDVDTALSDEASSSAETRLSSPPPLIVADRLPPPGTTARLIFAAAVVVLVVLLLKAGRPGSTAITQLPSRDAQNALPASSSAVLAPPILQPHRPPEMATEHASKRFFDSERIPGRTKR
jgi:serine/threonine protein kinase